MGGLAERRVATRTAAACTARLCRPKARRASPCVRRPPGCARRAPSSRCPALRAPTVRLCEACAQLSLPCPACAYRQAVRGERPALVALPGVRHPSGCARRAPSSRRPTGVVRQAVRGECPALVVPPEPSAVVGHDGTAASGAMLRSSPSARRERDGGGFWLLSRTAASRPRAVQAGEAGGPSSSRSHWDTTAAKIPTRATVNVQPRAHPALLHRRTALPPRLASGDGTALAAPVSRRLTSPRAELDTSGDQAGAPNNRICGGRPLDRSYASFLWPAVRRMRMLGSPPQSGGLSLRESST